MENLSLNSICCAVRSPTSEDDGLRYFVAELIVWDDPGGIVFRMDKTASSGYPEDAVLYLLGRHRCSKITQVLLSESAEKRLNLNLSLDAILLCFN